MLDDMSQMIKEKLLEELIDKMSSSHGDSMKPKGIGVSVEAPDKEHLADGLDKAKDLLGKGGPLPGLDSASGSPGDDDDDEQRLMDLLGDDDDDDKGKY